MSEGAIAIGLAQALQALVKNSDCPGKTAAAMVGAIMGTVGGIYGDEAAAQILYILADETATRAGGERASQP